MKEIEIFDTSGKKADALALPFDLQRKEQSDDAFACAVRVLRHSWRQGTVACKARGDVAFSNRKPWRQKGTGRARAGSARSPLWRKGGVTFGPQKRVRKLSIPRQHLRHVMNNLLFSVLDSKSLHQLDFQCEGQPNTKKAFDAISKAGLRDKKVVFFISYDDQLTLASVRNIPLVQVVFYDQPNAFDLANGACWVFLKKDADLFKGMVEKWN